jgi:cardiolipin synthase
MTDPHSNWNLPNTLTGLRILLTPFFGLAFASGRYDWALALFALAGVSDLLDGFLARLLNQRTRLGATLDPLADKLLVAVAYASLSMLGWIPAWLAVLVVGRDAVILGGAWHLQRSGVDVRASINPTLTSKLNTLFQLGLVGLQLLHRATPLSLAPLLPAAMLVVAGLTTVSGVSYVLLGFSLRTARPDKT